MAIKLEFLSLGVEMNLKGIEFEIIIKAPPPLDFEPVRDLSERITEYGKSWMISESVILEVSQVSETRIRLYEKEFRTEWRVSSLLTNDRALKYKLLFLFGLGARLSQKAQYLPKVLDLLRIIGYFL